MAIRNIEDLRTHLQWAIELEHSTLPPYLTALYSLHPDRNREAAKVLLSVAIEEMLHMTLAANVLNAIGGTPSLDHPAFIPTYPCYMTHSNRAFQVPVGRFSKEFVETVLRIEMPAPADAPPEDDNYETIGQFYEALEQGLIRLCDELGEESVFTGNPARQLTDKNFHYYGSGKVLPVFDLNSALAALKEIVEQGEGMDHHSIWDGDRTMFDPERQELSHYFRFHELLVERSYQEGDTPESGPTGEPFPVDWEAVFPVRANGRTADFAVDSPQRIALEDFNGAYSVMLREMHRSFNGEPGRMAVAVGLMYEVRYRALELVRMPSGDGETTVGLTFEYVPPGYGRRKSPRIAVRPNGPYIVEGGIPIRRKSAIVSEQGEPLTWRREGPVDTGEFCALCRCGKSDAKPYCDGSHVAERFDGTETADPAPRADRAVPYPGTQLTVKHDRTLCAFATFCENKVTDVWEMAEKTDDIAVRSQVIAMIERCPSGALTYELLPSGETIEPHLPQEISVIGNGPLWAMGGLTVERADGKPAEIRNRVTLCRCGGSQNKPFCDGTHIDLRFKG
ncbi:MAG: ferritin-like domain-containing protein [Capsulimonadales bacterium]|nr:ferritin-like domain-containing protein [Capsulimonadales bacterium]